MKSLVKFCNVGVVSGEEWRRVLVKFCNVLPMSVSCSFDTDFAFGRGTLLDALGL